MPKGGVINSPVTFPGMLAAADFVVPQDGTGSAPLGATAASQRRLARRWILHTLVGSHFAARGHGSAWTSAWTSIVLAVEFAYAG